MKIPLPCFGLEHDPVDPVCCSCPHQQDCLWYMRSRANKIPLNKLNFDLIPRNLQLRWADHSYSTDIEAPFLRHMYKDCYETVFAKPPSLHDGVDLYHDEIVKNARAANCSVRMFLLANMVAQSIAEQVLDGHTEKARATRFHSKMLSGKLAVTRAVEYAKVCNNRYGTFSLTSLSTFAGKKLDLNEMDEMMLHSEVTAGHFVVARKIHHGGPPFEALYEEEELALSPYWLALEASYKTTVLDPYRAGLKPATKLIKDHRKDVYLVIHQFKSQITDQTYAFQARQRIMPEAVNRVLNYFNVQPEDLLYEATPITDPMALWVQLGRTLQQYHCWLMLNGQPSYFERRSTKEVHLGS